MTHHQAELESKLYILLEPQVWNTKLQHVSFFHVIPVWKITLLCLGEMFIQAQLSYVILLPSVVLDQGWNSFKGSV